MSVPPATQKPWTLQTTGFSDRNRLMKPRTLRVIIWKSMIGSQSDPGRGWPRGPRGRGATRVLVARRSLAHPLALDDQVVAAAEARAVAGQRDHVDLGVEVGALDAVGELARHLERDPVAALGAVRA